MRLPDGGEAVLVRLDGETAVIRVGTGPLGVCRIALHALSSVSADAETDRHRRFRRYAALMGELGS